MKLINQTPTDAEKQMYLFAGFYVVEETDTHIEYAVCHTDNSLRNDFPLEFDIDEMDIDYDGTIVFDKLSEQVKINTYVDVKLINLIANRANELGWKE